MYRELTAAELAELEILYAIDPWGPERADLANGILCSLTDACHRAKGNPQAPIKYMPYVDGLIPDAKPTQQTVEEMQAIWKQAVAAFGSVT